MTDDKLTPQDWDILVFVEEDWVLKGTFPTVSRISQITGIPDTEVTETLFKEVFKKALDVRGIQVIQDQYSRLKPLQLAAINSILNISDPRSRAAKLRALGIPPQTFANWKKQKYFMEAMRVRSEALFGETMPEMHKALVDKALDGDPTAMKQYYAMSGRWSDKHSVETMNVRFLLLKVIETIQRHVSDPSTLAAIANDFEALMGGENVRPELDA